MSADADRRFLARALWALVLAHARYWLRVAPIVRGQLRRWETRAREIPDPVLARLARGKLADERFNVEVAAMLATIAPARFRRDAIHAIVALQVMYDYLDAITEQPTAEPLRDGLQCFTAFTDAVTPGVCSPRDYYAYYPGDGDAGYLADLARTARAAIAALPANAAIRAVVPSSTARCGEAQVRIHAAQHTGAGQLERWAADQAQGTGLDWRDWLLGAIASVVSVHALVALAADASSTSRQARELDNAYLVMSALTTMLDHLVDYESDALTGERSYIDLYDDGEDLARELAALTRESIERARAIPNGAHHLMILSGIVAYYTSQASAMGEFARPVTERVRDQLRPLITPTLATLHAWRLAKRMRSQAARSSTSTSK
jgi:tetraprenyl-beta-curcumene synthase